MPSLVCPSGLKKMGYEFVPSKSLQTQMVQKELLQRELARRDLFHFTKYTLPTFTHNHFHETYYKILDMFAHSILNEGGLRRLMVTVPPQHGKSEGSTRRLPPFLLGHNSNLKIATSSYNQTFVRKFSRDNRRIMKSREYKSLFPGTRYPEPTDTDYARGLDEFEIPDALGGNRFVGRGGPLTGSPVDVMVLDDLYKDYAEGNSPTIREAVIDWYTSVVRTRLHNDSSQLIVFTRWHEEDLIGYLEREEEVVDIHSWADLENPDPYVWYKINFPAIQTGEPTEIDNRFEGEGLWPEKHSLRKLQSERALDPEKFESLYQGNPRPIEGLLYTKFDTYDQPPKRFRFIGSYVDTADMGADWLCSIVYMLGKDGYIYVLDVLYTNVAMEESERLCAEQHYRLKVDKADFESNNGGRGFMRAVRRICGEVHHYTSCRWEAFHQGANKESRLLSSSASVQQYILFPSNWNVRWPQFYSDMMRFRKNFKANTHDDACFIAETMVTTLTGDMPIAKIKVGDYVYTPYGFRKVLSAGCTGFKKVIKKMGLTGTPDHKVFTKSGFMPLDAFTGIGQNDIISEKGVLQWKYKKILYSMVSGTVSWDRESIILVSQQQIRGGSVLKDYMWRFGNFIIKKKYPKAFVFTTKTVIVLIMSLIIWNWLKIANIYHSIKKRNGKIKNTEKKQKNILTVSAIKQLNGTGVKRAEHGIDSTARSVWKKGNLSRLFVKTVEPHSCQSRDGLCTAAPLVERNTIGTTIKSMSTPYDVKSAQCLSKEPITKNQRDCPGLAVQNVNLPLGIKPVYNITVEGVGVYYANGVLVSNCDALTGVWEKCLKWVDFKNSSLYDW